MRIHSRTPGLVGFGFWAVAGAAAGLNAATWVWIAMLILGIAAVVYAVLLQFQDTRWLRPVLDYFDINLPPHRSHLQEAHSDEPDNGLAAEGDALGRQLLLFTGD